MSTSITDAKDRLLKRRAELSRLHEHHTAEEHLLDTSAEPDWPDRAALHADDEVLHRLSDRERIELVEIDAALKRIADHHYGACENCGRAIPEARLAALPFARRCIGCQA